MMRVPPTYEVPAKHVRARRGDKCRRDLSSVAITEGEHTHGYCHRVSGGGLNGKRKEPDTDQWSQRRTTHSAFTYRATMMAHEAFSFELTTATGPLRLTTHAQRNSMITIRYAMMCPAESATPAPTLTRLCVRASGHRRLLSSRAETASIDAGDGCGRALGFDPSSSSG